MHSHSARDLAQPVVVCVRGPSRSGKTALIERLVAALEPGVQVAYVKRTHHELDLPGKASGRVWSQSPSAMVLRAPDRLQVNRPAGEGDAASLIAELPPDIDLALLETHAEEPFPALVAAQAEPGEREAVIGRWSLDTLADNVPAAVEAIHRLLPSCLELHRAVRAASRAHGGHACAGIILGTRLAVHGAAMLGVEVPDVHKRLVVVAETDRCAVDAIQAVTGCRPGKRTLRLLDYGKLAATFIDQHTGTAVRVAVRGDLREQVGAHGKDRHARQREAYLAFSPAQLFTVRGAAAEIGSYDLPGPPQRRVTCARCGEEVSDGRDVQVEDGVRCKPCAGASATQPIGGIPWE